MEMSRKAGHDNLTCFGNFATETSYNLILSHDEGLL